MTQSEFRQYCIDLMIGISWAKGEDLYEPLTQVAAAHLADMILETLECHPEVVEKDPTDV